MNENHRFWCNRHYHTVFRQPGMGECKHPMAGRGGDYLGSQTDETYRYILLESRLPAAIAALLSGAALATSGLLLQTAFRNPLAGPDVFGISSGAGLAVAIVMLAFGGNIALDDLGVGFLGNAGRTMPSAVSWLSSSQPL